MNPESKKHWENVYETKQPHQVGWTQERPEASLKMIESFQLAKTASIIDIGGGDSKLVEFLLEEGYTDITVLDISTKAIERAKKRLGEKANQITWIVSDITEFKPKTTYDIWHDRAAFHFLTTPEQIEKYIQIANKAVSGNMAIGTFSDKGPKKCSGLEITQYNEEKITNTFLPGFEKIQCHNEDHTTPSGFKQNFLFCTFKKVKA